MSVRLDQIVPWGRSFDEYRLMFDLSDRDLAGTILGCGDGPASFNAELTARGGRVISCDPIYVFDESQVRDRFEQAAGPIMTQVRARPENYVWTYHRGPDDLLHNRRDVLETFLSDFPKGRREGRYVAAALPRLPFADGAFDLAVCSHLLFLYSELLSVEFHVISVFELLRVAREVRIFPLTALDCELSPHVDRVVEQVRKVGRGVRIVPVEYQLQRNGNQMLRIA